MSTNEKTSFLKGENSLLISEFNLISDKIQPGVFGGKWQADLHVPLEEFGNYQDSFEKEGGEQKNRDQRRSELIFTPSDAK